MRTFSKLVNGQVVEHSLTEDDVRRRFPNTSFCVPFQPPDDYEEEFENGEAPCAGPLENLALLPPSRVDGLLVRQYSVTPASPEQVQQRTDVQAALLRSRRNQLLTQSDWTQLADSGADQAAWAAYRQTLRALPQQEGFPWDVVWPEPPTHQAPSTASQASQAEPPMAEPPVAQTLGQVWTDPQGVNWVVVQARTAGGRFAADDPDTDEREDLAWERAANAGEDDGDGGLESGG